MKLNENYVELPKLERKKRTQKEICLIFFAKLKRFSRQSPSSYYRSTRHLSDCQRLIKQIAKETIKSFALKAELSDEDECVRSLWKICAIMANFLVVWDTKPQRVRTSYNKNGSTLYWLFFSRLSTLFFALSLRSSSTFAKLKRN